MKPRYIIVNGRGLEALVKNVNDAYMNGYHAIGGPFKLDCDYDTWYGQAMVLQ